MLNRKLAFLVTSLAIACGGPADIELLERPLVVDVLRAPTVTNDLGWAVELDELRVVLEGVQLTTSGETRTARLGDLLIPSAHAHPGHVAGGEVIGELEGRHVVDFLAEGALGQAALIAGRYDGANFVFGTAAAADTFEGDPLVGHSAVVAGTATRGDVVVRWRAEIAQLDGRELIGAAFGDGSEELGESTEAVGIALLLEDPFEPDTLFDGMDFGAPTGADEERTFAAEGELENRLSRAMASHDFWRLRGMGS